MFSRSEKTEEVTDPMAEPSGQRSPMVLAALAGLLAIAGAFLLVWYLNTDSGDVADDGSPSGELAENAESEGRRVFVVTKIIPRGTSALELAETPAVYLTTDMVPEQFVAASAITSVAELEELAGQVLASDVLPGEQLLRGRFRNPSDFDSVTETFLEAESGIEAPPGHHSVVFELPSTRALGGNIRPGEKFTVIANFRVTPPEGQTFEISVVVLNSVELLNIDSALEVQGQIANDVNQVGTAARGNFIITAAVTPEELTDLTYAIEYGEIILATALEDFENEGFPRAITTMTQVVGDDGVWLAELEDGNIVDLIALITDEPTVDAQSITLDLPSDDEDEVDGPEPDPEPEPDADAETEIPGDS